MTTGHVAHVRKLYKLILRLHRNLPDDLRFLGDSYAKEEFRRHKKCRPEEAQTFLNEWQEYATSMFRQVSPTRAQRQNPEDNEPRIADEADQVAIPLGAPRAPAPINGERPVIRPTPRYGNRLPSDVFVRLTPDQMFQLYELEVMAGRVYDAAAVNEGDFGAANVQPPPNVQVPNAQGPNAQAPNAQADAYAHGNGGTAGPNGEADKNNKL